MAKETLINGMSKKTQNSIIGVLIAIVVIYLAYGFYTATKIYAKSKSYYLNTAKNIIIDIAKTVTGLTKTEVMDLKMSEIYNKFMLYSDKNTLLSKKGYSEAFKWFIEGQKDSDSNIDTIMKNALNYSMNNQNTIFTKILY